MDTEILLSLAFFAGIGDEIVVSMHRDSVIWWSGEIGYASRLFFLLLQGPPAHAAVNTLLPRPFFVRRIRPLSNALKIENVNEVREEHAAV